LGLLPTAEVEEVPAKALKEQLGTKGDEGEKKKGKDAPRRRPV
jgi:hypothetical protein